MHLCNCFRSHCSHMVLKEPERNSFFWQNCLVDLIQCPLTQEYIACNITLVSSKVIMSEKKSHICSTWILSIAVVWMNRKRKNYQQYLSQSKIQCSNFTAIGWKKLHWSEVEIVLRNNFDTNSKILPDN